MNKDLHDIDNLFKQSIEDHLEEVPPELWQNIDHSLDKKQAAFYKKRYFTVRAAAVVLLLVGGLTIAAILRYHSAVKPGGNETVVTNTGHSGLKVEQKVNKNASEELVTNGQAIPQQEDPSNSSKKSSVAKSESSKEYESTDNSTYSAGKNDEILAAGVNSKTNKQRQGIKVKPISSVPAYGTVSKENKLPDNIIGESRTENVSKDAVDGVTRTTFVSTRVLDVNEFTINNTVPGPKPASVIAPDFSSALSAPKSSKSPYNGDWSVSVNYGQNLNLNTLKDDDHFRDPRNNSREAKRTEQETRSYSTGIGVQKEVSGNFSVQSGLQYFSSRTTIKPKLIFAETDARGEVRYHFNCSSGDSYIPSKTGVPPVIGDSIRTNSSETSLSYLQVPLLASYRVRFGKFSFLPSAGIQTNFLLNGELTSSLVQPSGDEEVSSSIKGLRSMYFSGVIQPQFNYSVSDRISFDLNPYINFSLSPINKGTAVKTYQNMFTLGAGMRIKL